MRCRTLFLSGLLLALTASSALAGEPRALPLLPAPEFRVAEVFDNRLEMWIELYATKNPEVVDYATARKVLRVIMHPDGTPGYDLAPHPLFIWWGRALWKDVEEDGINGNEVIQEDNVIFHPNPYLRLYRDQ
ncbi:MAG: hypothetical protein EPO02_02825 [Nitrospirae bacterium]|nr:MAG: hypothetical protein EPO02_02825 [Nitrospirota bacterium]